MQFTDPHTTEENRYECTDCLGRVVTDEHREVCPDCGGRLKNIAVPRE
jgi:rRNA maturation endonuclease Nob1